MFHSKGAPLSVRNEPRKRFVQECSPSPVRECSSKMLRPGPFVCAGERKVVIAVLCPRRSTASVPWGSGRCGAAEFRAPDVAVDANGGGAGGAWAGAGTGAGVGAGADAVAAPALQGFGRRLRLSRAARRRRAARPSRAAGFVERYCHGASSLRALAAAMRIAQKRNRSPQNGAGRDDGSSQCSLLW